MSMRKSTMLVAAMLGLIGGVGSGGDNIEIKLDTEDYWLKRWKQEENDAMFPSRKKRLREKNGRTK